MRKLLLILTALFFFHSAKATHLLGGEITWEALGNDQYIFTLKIYRDCSGIPLSSMVDLNGPSGKISLIRKSLEDISPQCYGPSQPFGCGYNTNNNGVELHTYVSSAVSIVSVMKASGLEFSYSFCCRPTLRNLQTQDNMFIKSTMFQKNVSAPQFTSGVVYAIAASKEVAFTAAQPGIGDSLHYSLMAPLKDSITPVAFTSAFNGQAPLPSPIFDSANAPVSLNQNTGVVSFDIKSPKNGKYAMAMEIENWRAGQLTSIISRDVVVLHQNDSLNNPPLVGIDTAGNSLQQNGNYLSYKVHTLPDTLDFVMSAVDLDTNSGGSLQQVSMMPIGMALDTPYGYNSFNETAQLNLVNSGSAALVNFKWIINQEHLQDISRYFFVFKYSDDACPINGTTHITLEVEIRKPALIQQDTVYACASDSILLKASTVTGNARWSPALQVADSTAPTTLAQSDYSRYFYLEDPQFPGQRDSIWVASETVDSFSLSYNNGLLSLTDSVKNGSVSWEYNGIPLNYTLDTLTPLGPGQYVAFKETNYCNYTTDTIMVLPGTFSTHDPSGSDYLGKQFPILGSMGVRVRLDGSGFLSSVKIPGVVDLEAEASSAYSIELRIYDQNDQEVFKNGFNLQLPLQGYVNIPVQFQLKSGQEYTLAITGDSSYTFSLLENAIVPATPWNNGLNLLGYSESTVGPFPAYHSDYLLPLSLTIDNFISRSDALIYERPVFYPNPVEDSFTLVLTEPHSEIELLDLNGKVIRRYTTNKERFEIYREAIPSGIYILNIESKNKSFSEKLIFE